LTRLSQTLFAILVGTLLPSSTAFAQSMEISVAVLPDAPSALLLQSQSSTATPVQQATPQTEEQRKAEANTELKQEEQQRLLGIVPNFNVVLNGKAAPLTAKQKFSLMLHGVKDPYYFGIAFISAGYSEINDSHTGFGWGPAGFFKRAGASYADNADGAFWGNAVLPALLHQDPRYFRQGTGSIKSRFIHAALSTVLCHGDNGKSQFNFSNVAGNFIAGGISNLYYPANERGVGLTLENGAEVTLFGALGGQVLEFGPDAVNHLFHHKKKQ